MTSDRISDVEKGGCFVPPFVTTGSIMSCTMGATPASLIVASPIVSATTPAATVADVLPNTNIPPFGLCLSPGNPQVAAATAAAEGVLTPQPCQPATGAPWIPGSVTAQIGGVPGVLATSTCQCLWGGTIGVVAPAQVLVMGI